MIEFDPVRVHDWLRRSAKRYPDKEALICGDERWTYRQIERHVHHLAVWLVNKGIKRHDRIVVFLDNCVETVIALYAILKAGGTFVIVSGSLKEQKLRYIIDNAGAAALLTHTAKAKVVSGALDNISQIMPIIWVGKKDRIPQSFISHSFFWPEIFNNITDPDVTGELKSNGVLPRVIDVDLASLIYTSGSTGEPKGVMETHQNMIAAARSIIQYIENQNDDIILNVLPLSFDYGLYQVIMAFMFGGTVVLEKSFLYLHQVLQRIEKEKVTGFPIVPTIVAMLLQLKNLDTYDFSSLRYMTNTGAALPVDHMRSLRKQFPHIRMFSMFGLTECKRVGYIPPEQLDQRPDSVGKAMPNCEVFVLDEQGRQVPPGSQGQLVIRGANVMQGYWNDPVLTDNTYHSGRYPADRLLYSGDFFRQDDQGYLYFVGRKDDMIKCKGERISAKELENTISAMPGVAEVAVVGVADDIFGQAVKAYVVPKEQNTLTENDILKYCTANLESFAVPKWIELSKNLPKTPNGKIDKKQLK